MKDTKNNIAALEFYTKSQYALLLEKAFDAEKLEKTWEEWFEKFVEFKTKLKKIGIEVKPILVDVNELQDYCSMNGYENTETNRIMFAAYLFAYCN